MSKPIDAILKLIGDEFCGTMKAGGGPCYDGRQPEMPECKAHYQLDALLTRLRELEAREQRLKEMEDNRAG